MLSPHDDTQHARRTWWIIDRFISPCTNLRLHIATRVRLIFDDPRTKHQAAHSFRSAQLCAVLSRDDSLRREQPIWIERTAVGSSIPALLQCLKQLDLGGEIAVRVVTRMAEVLEGRHTDDEISSADVMRMRDMSNDSPEATKQRILQHSLFVQVLCSQHRSCHCTPAWSASHFFGAQCRSMARQNCCATYSCTYGCLQLHTLRPGLPLES
jgi:hypothetical protein